MRPLRGGTSLSPLSFNIPHWWDDIRSNGHWQHGSFYGLAVAYTVLAVIALVQLVRISRRCPQYGWTTQKVFHLLNLVVCLFRAIVMALHSQIQGPHHVVFKLLLNDSPGLLFFSTYTLLILFWAEIYQQARGQATARLRPAFMYANASVYVVQIGLLCLCGWGAAHQSAIVASSVFLAAVSMLAAAGFVLYGGRLFLMLQRFPIESPGRLKKLREVGVVTVVCTACFLVRAAFIMVATIDAHDFGLDAPQHPLFNIFYYTCVEILPSAIVLYVLRKLPPKRAPVYTAPDLEAP